MQEEAVECGLEDDCIFPSTLTYFIRNSLVGYVNTLIFNADDIIVEKTKFTAFSMKHLIFKGNTAFINEETFSNCYSLESVILPKDMPIIKADVFRYCIKLKSVQFPDNLETIRSYAFESCESLNTINFPNTLWEIFEGAFSSCTSLTELNFPKSLNAFSYTSFMGCSNLTLVIFNSKVKIFDYAFYSCYNLKEIRYNSSQIDQIYISYMVPYINLVNVSKNITIYARRDLFSETKNLNMSISCEVQEINSGELDGHNDFVNLEQFAYTGLTEISGNMSLPDNVSCINLNPEYKGKLFGKRLSKYRICGKDYSSKLGTVAIIGISLSCIVVASIIIVLLVIYILRRRKTKGFSEIVTSTV